MLRVLPFVIALALIAGAVPVSGVPMTMASDCHCMDGACEHAGQPTAAVLCCLTGPTGAHTPATPAPVGSQTVSAPTLHVVAVVDVQPASSVAAPAWRPTPDRRPPDDPLARFSILRI